MIKRWYIASALSLPVIYYTWKVTITLSYAILQEAIPDIAEMRPHLENTLSWPVGLYGLVIFWGVFILGLHLIARSFPD